MKVLVFGAMGRTGGAVVDQAMAAGHIVTAFVRKASEARWQQAKVAQGDATSRPDVDAAMRGQEAVIDTIGGKTPWKHTTLERSAVRNIIGSMHANGVRRLLATSMLGIGASRRNSPIFLRLLLATYLRGANEDKTAMEAAVESSGLDWTIFRPAVLTDGSATGDVKIFDGHLADKARAITRTDLAAFMVSELASNMYIAQAATIANR